MTTRLGWLWSSGFALVVIAFFFFVPPVPQDQKFHLFADGRNIAGIPNFWNVVSNLLFAIVGILGLRAFRSLTDRALFTGVLLIAFGSAYYHLAPGDARLVWDRLPMTVVFMAFVASVVSSADGKQTPRDPSPWFLGVLIALGTGSVLWWSVTRFTLRSTLENTQNRLLTRAAQKRDCVLYRWRLEVARSAA